MWGACKEEGRKNRAERVVRADEKNVRTAGAEKERQTRSETCIKLCPMSVCRHLRTFPDISGSIGLPGNPGWFGFCCPYTVPMPTQTHLGRLTSKGILVGFGWSFDVDRAPSPRQSRTHPGQLTFQESWSAWGRLIVHRSHANPDTSGSTDLPGVLVGFGWWWLETDPQSVT